MSLIHILDEVTSNQIAAGEVVERPVNAVKELVENSIDAGAHMIEVEIADGGMTYIRVTDDGSGMTREDAKLSVIRHATSKISSVKNIYHICSLGFRGEALPSIMSVSRTTITTRRAEDMEGTAIDVTGGAVGKIKGVGAPAGTTVEVRELFYNVPARKKFLKSERTESSRINTMIGKLALANPDISFTLINNGRTVIETPGNGRLMDVISALYGVKVTGEMLEDGKELKVFSFQQKDLPKFTEQAKRYGVLYCVLRDKNTKSDTAMVDIIARAEDAAKIQRISDRFELGKVDKASIVSEAEKDVADREAVANEVPTKSRGEIIVEEAMGKPMQKEGNSHQNPSVAKTDKSPLSERDLETTGTHTDKGVAKAADKKPSVKEKLDRYKAAAKAEKEAERTVPEASKEKPKTPEANRQTVHRQPKKSKKSKER